MNCQQNCHKLKKNISKLGLNRIFSEIELKKTLGSAWKTRVGRVSGNKQLFFLRLRVDRYHGYKINFQTLTSDGWLGQCTEWHSRRQEKNKILKAFSCCKNKSFKRNKNMLRLLLHNFMRLLEVQANMQVV